MVRTLRKSGMHDENIWNVGRNYSLVCYKEKRERAEF